MKKLLIYIMTLIGFLACNDDFTDSTPVGTLSDENLKNELGVNLLLTGAYSALDIGSIGGYRADGGKWWMDAISDDAHKGSTDGDQQELLTLELFDWNSSNRYLLEQWKGLFAGVNRANAVLALINSIEGGIEAYGNQIAEARFLRAHFNFELTKIYGFVPYISEQNYVDLEFNQPNDIQIWEQIEADYAYGIEHLPDTQSEIGRPTSWTAKAFKAKADLFQGEWSDALIVFTDIIDNGPYQLLSNYGDNWRLAGELGPESIFAIQYVADGGSSYNGNRGNTLNFPHGGSAPFSSCCGFFQPSVDLVNAFQTDGMGLPIFDRTGKSDFKNTYLVADSEPFELDMGPIDPRMDFTAGRRGLDYQGYGMNPGQEWVRASAASFAGPYLPRKHIWHKDDAANIPGSGRDSGVNFHFMRYSDLLLMAAESLVKSGGSLATATDYVNQIRNRVKSGRKLQNLEDTGNAANYQIEPYTVTFSDETYAMSAIRMERRLELAMEGKRLADISRWGTIGMEIINTYLIREKASLNKSAVSVGNLDSPYETKHRYFPVPLNAIDLSGNILEQNEGY